MEDFDIGIFFIALVLGFLIGVGMGYLACRNQDEHKEIDNESPVKEMRIDTLYITRDSLIYRTKYLDSVKYDTIQKVYNLNDTATLQLFLQLVSE